MIKATSPAFAYYKSPQATQFTFQKPFIRSIHPGHGLHRAATAPAIPPQDQSVTAVLPASQQPSRPPLSLLPLKDLLRSYLINLISSNRFLLTLSLRMLSLLASSKSPFLNPDRNPVLRFLLKKTFYAQFCGGETRSEIQGTVNGLKKIGFAGVILAYAKEIVVQKDHDFSKCRDQDDESVRADVEAWKQGNLKTIDLTGSGGIVGLKFTGAGGRAVQLLAEQRPPDALIDRAITEICELAKARDVRLLFDAEQDAVQRGIYSWTLRYQKMFNREKSGKAVVYGTYQAYLRSTPATVAEHLDIAQREGFVLGVKLVRGAYMASDRRELFWDTKAETDRAYDGIAEALITRKYNDVLRPCGTSIEELPDVNVVLATHNHASVEKAMRLRKQQSVRGENKIDLVYGQLMGMADEVSCELALAGKRSVAMEVPEKSAIQEPIVFKYLVWGSVGECTKYLLRRAEENRDAVVRAKESRAALWAELYRRSMRGA